MKPSHFVTPRTMEDATFQPWGQAIHGKVVRPYDWQDRLVMWVAAIMLICTLAIIYFYPQVTA